MPLPAVPVLVSVASMLSAIGAWLLEMAVMYGRKIAFYSVVVALFFGTLATISTAVFATLNSISGSSYFAQASPYLGIAAGIFPSNFIALASLIVAIEFQIFFWRWAMKVLDIKVNFFGS